MQTSIWEILGSLKESSNFLLNIFANIIIYHVWGMIILQEGAYFLQVIKV